MSSPQSQPSLCEEVQMAEMARLDGEPAGLTTAEIQKHLAGCPSCTSAIEALSALHSDLSRQGHDDGLASASAGIDLWPAIEPKLAAAATRKVPEAGLLLVALVIVWRLAQLSWVDLPGPVVNSVVPLAMIVILLRRLAGGDPFAIQSSLLQLQQKGASQS